MTASQKFIYILGREIRIVRTLYCKLTGGKYLWGVYQGLVDAMSHWKSHS